MDVEIRDERPGLQDAADVYRSVEWAHYVEDMEKLQRAFDGSSAFVAAYQDDTLIGFLRAMTDGETILYLQDILVRPDFHRTGVGRLLVERCLERYEHVRQRILLTDDRDSQRAFYESLGFSNVASLEVHKLNAYVQFRGLELK